MPRSTVACAILLVGAFAAPVQAAPDPACVIALVVAGIPDPVDLLACGFVGSEGFIVLVGTGIVPGILADPWTSLVAAPLGWTCNSAGNPVSPGDPLADANPSVTCAPPPGSLPLDCLRVGAQVVHTYALAGTAALTSSCGSLSATSTYSAPGPAAYASNAGSQPFPLTCALDNSLASPTGSWIAWCDVNG